MANKIDAKQLSENCVLHTISYDAGPDCGPVAGMTLTGGQPAIINGLKVVRFETKKNGQQIALKYENRPDLAKLVEEYEAIEAQKEAEREARWMARRAEEEAIARPLLDAMNRQADELRKQIPAGHVEVKVEKVGDADGDPIYGYTADGVKLSWRDVKIVGCASATYPNALAPFAEVVIASIERSKLEQIRAAQAEKATADAAAREARRKELLETPIPQDALDDYNRYRGDADAAWEAEDETAWARINKWALYIETQYGMHPQKMARKLRETTREQNYGIND